MADTASHGQSPLEAWSKLIQRTMEGYMEHLLRDLKAGQTVGPLSALDVVKEITGSQQVNVVGYCIGGTLLSMVLPYSDSFNAV